MPIVVNKEERVKEICEKAYSEFTANGLENFSLNRFVSDINISKGQFYHYFKTKDDLVFEVMSQKSLELIGLAELYLSNAKSLHEKLLIFFALYIGDDEELQKFQSLMYDSFHIYIHSQESKVREYNQTLYRWMDSKLIEIFEQEKIDRLSSAYIKSISATADGMYLRSLMVDDYNLQEELTQYIAEIAQLVEVNRDEL
jgi:AcrR family transcriptional regulator